MESGNLGSIGVFESWGLGAFESWRLEVLGVVGVLESGESRGLGSLGVLGILDLGSFGSLGVWTPRLQVAQDSQSPILKDCLQDSPGPKTRKNQRL